VLREPLPRVVERFLWYVLSGEGSRRRITDAELDASSKHSSTEIADLVLGWMIVGFLSILL